MRLAIALVLVLVTCPIFSSDWHQFRGPSGQGHADPADLPVEFDNKSGVVWKAEIQGKGWSSPVVLDGRIWLTTATEEGKSLRVIALDSDTGALLLDREVFRTETPVVKHAKNSFASPTPVLEPGRVYVSFGTIGTACLAAKTGETLWKNTQPKIDHEVGPGSSPVLYEDFLLLHFDGTDKQFVVAFNKITGEIAWKTNRPPLDGISGEMRKAFCTPLVIETGGRKEMISVGAQRVLAYDPATGGELWRIDFTGFSNVPRPVFNGELVFISTGFNPPDLMAIRPGGNGNVTHTHVAWRTGKQAPTNPSPIILGEHLYMMSDRGILTALEAATGRELYRERMEGQFSASPIASQGRIYWCSEEGECFVTAEGLKFKLLARNSFGEQFMASPAVIGDDLILRTDKHVYRITKSRHKGSIR